MNWANDLLNSERLNHAPGPPSGWAPPLVYQHGDVQHTGLYLKWLPARAREPGTNYFVNTPPSSGDYLSQSSTQLNHMTDLSTEVNALGRPLTYRYLVPSNAMTREASQLFVALSLHGGPALN